MARVSTPSDSDLQRLAGMVSEVRSDLPAHGLPLSLLTELKDVIACDLLLCQGYDTIAQRYWFSTEAETCAVSGRFRTSTRFANGIRPACIATSYGHRGSTTTSVYA